MGMTYQEWVEKYQPICNTHGEPIEFDTEGADLEFVLKHDKENVWTECETDVDYGKWTTYIKAGRRVINRVSYRITRKKWQSLTEFVLSSTMP